MVETTYEFLVRDARTLAILGELRPQDIERAQWTRLQFEAGSWSLTIPRRAVEASSTAAGVDLIARQNLIDIRRNGAAEHIAIILVRRLDPSGEMWTIEGLDLLDWLNRRIVGRTAADPRSGVAETVLKAYVTANLGSGAAAARQATGELTGKTFSVEADALRGGAVTHPGQRVSLAALTADLCRQGDLLQSIVLTDTGLEYRVSEPVDATQGGGGTPFSVNMDNVEGLGWREDYRAVQTALTVGGEGTGATRLTREVEDAASIAADFRREGVYDARDATTNPQMDAIGAAEIARQLGAAVAADVVPLTTSENGRYREDWDVGWNITVAVPAARIAAIDRRVASATVSLTREQGERISLTLGTERPTSTLRRIGNALALLQRGAHA